MHSRDRLEKIYLTRLDGVILNGEPSEYLLKNSNSNLHYRLNDTAAKIWRMCEYQVSVEEIITTFSEIYGLPKSTISSDVISVLNYFSQNYLISIWEDQYTSPPGLNNVVTYHKPTDSLYQLLESFRNNVMDLFPDKGERITPKLASDDLQNAISENTANAKIEGNALFLKSIELDGIQDIIASVIQELDKVFGSFGVNKFNTGRILYAGNSFMGWHTNEDYPGRRIYCNWSENDGENEFRYIDPDSGGLITSPEPPGWSLKSFYIPLPPNRLWHCINASGKRIALGFSENQFKSLREISTH